MTSHATRRGARLVVTLLAGICLGNGASGPADEADTRLAALRRSERSARPPASPAAAAELAHIGNLYLEGGRLGPAIEILLETIERNPDDELSLARLVLGYVRRGDFDFARSYLELAAQRDLAGKSSADLFVEIGERFSGANRLSSAVLAWQLYRRSGGSDPAVLSRLERATRELSATAGQRLLESDRFMIFADEALPLPELRRIEDGLSADYDRQAALFGVPLSARQVVVLHSGRRYFSLVSIPDWVSGVFDGKIRLSLDASRPSSPQVEAVLSHELAHAFIREVSKGRAPGWLHEGLAQWCSGRRIPRRDFRRELAGWRPRSLAEMEGTLAVSLDVNSMRAGYAEALGLVEYLVERHGEGTVFCLVRDLGEGADISEALRREAQASATDLVARWSAWAGL